MPKTIRLLLGDQLNQNHSWFQQTDPSALYVMMEVRQETDYVRHHRQKVLAIFMAMRAFAKHLVAEGHRVKYYTLDDPENTHSIPQNLQKLISDEVTTVEYLEPDEYRLDQQMQAWCQTLSIFTCAHSSEHFLTCRTDLAEMFKGKKTYLMETFYRNMRRKYDVLMEGTQPTSGRWNYDAENRKKLPQKIEVPKALAFAHDARSIDDLLTRMRVETLGDGQEGALPWPITRQESLQVLDHFVAHLLPLFGNYQDAMHTDHRFLFHSRLSFALNVKLLHPLEVVKAVESAWQTRPDKISLSQAEGFIRQILGWREYMRGVYWAHMPKYAEKNFLGHSRPLPSWYWTGETKMNCLKHAIGQSLSHAYAHHIQRLMITGNFALLAGIHPDEVDAWYLGIYIDAFEWVEVTNTRGMSQFADGGMVGTKPYVSTANYVHKMSNYCGQCHYQRAQKHGEGACPFNSLYWHFYDRHREAFQNNPRVGMAYRTWDKMNPSEKGKILEQADKYLQTLDSL